MMKSMLILVTFLALFHFSGVDGCTQPKSGMVYQIVIGGGISNPKGFLSTPSDGGKTDLYINDDGSGRQQWELTEHGGYWNIMVRDGVGYDRKYLSTNSDGTRVDIYTHDDASGRQRWLISDAPGDGPWCNIRIQGGVFNFGEQKSFLSTTSSGDKCDLYYNDDNSGRQKWKFVELGPINPTPQPTPKPISITSASGYWEPQHNCHGCSSYEYSLEIGIETASGQEVSNEFASSMSSTIESGFEISASVSAGWGPVSGSVSATATHSTSESKEHSQSVARTMSRVMTETSTRTTTVRCEKDGFYQWVMEAKMSEGSPIKVSSEAYACIDNPFRPSCLPGYCADDNCQLCRDEESGSDPVTGGDDSSGCNSGTFVSNEGNRWANQTPFKVDSNTYVFGGEDGGWFKMASVDAHGKFVETRHTNEVSDISQLTADVWHAANRGGSYSVEDVRCSASAAAVPALIALESAGNYCCQAKTVDGWNGNWNGVCWGKQTESDCNSNGQKCEWTPDDCRRELDCLLLDEQCESDGDCCSGRCKVDDNLCR